jgi:hypothetical protein
LDPDGGRLLVAGCGPNASLLQHIAHGTNAEVVRSPVLHPSSALIRLDRDDAGW